MHIQTKILNWPPARSCLMDPCRSQGLQLTRGACAVRELRTNGLRNVFNRPTHTYVLKKSIDGYPFTKFHVLSSQEYCHVSLTGEGHVSANRAITFSDPWNRFLDVPWCHWKSSGWRFSDQVPDSGGHIYGWSTASSRRTSESEMDVMGIMEWPTAMKATARLSPAFARNSGSQTACHLGTRMRSKSPSRLLIPPPFSWSLFGV